MLSSFKARLCATVTAFRFDRRGQVAITFGLTLVPLVTMLGVALDYSNLNKTRTALQTSVDAVALGAQQQSITTNAALLSYAQRFVPATAATYSSTDGSMCVTAQQSISTNFLQFVKISTLTTSASACSINQTATSTTYEIALALDNTGSMGVADLTTLKTKMASEITAAKNFVSQMFTSIPTTNMQISLVPFTTAVNVGTQYASASWIDTAGKSSIHWENFPKLSTTAAPIAAEDAWNPQSRFDLFTQVNQSWAGCVEERPQPYTLTDTAASAATPDTQFVPLFAPDESDTPNTNYSSYNSYLNDSGGYCVPGDIYDTNDQTGTFKDGTTFFGDNQQKLCKYAIKWAANNPSTSTQSAAAQTAIASYYDNLWGVSTNTANAAAKAVIQNGTYSVNGSNVNFCYSSCYYQQWSWNSGWTTIKNTSNWTTTTLPASYVNNPQGSSWTTSSSTVTTTGWGASSSYSSWNGSGWGYGGSGWGTGNGWGWGAGSGNSSGFKSSSTNPGQTITGAVSSQYIGPNQFNIGGGANSGCDPTLQPVTTLTNNQVTLTANIAKMTANGATNLVSGLLWAWRTISPNGPFNTTTTPVKPYGTSNNKKIIVFMTDGFNNWEPDDSQNKGVYSSFGYYHNNRIGSQTVNGSTQTATASNNRAYLDAAFLQACTNAKNAGIEIYTVAFTISNAPIDAQGQTTVQNCATDSGHYFKATNGTELNSFFQSIGQSVTQSYLRLKS